VPERARVRHFAKVPGIVRFDLYDNGEILNLAYLMGDENLMRKRNTSATTLCYMGMSTLKWISRESDMAATCCVVPPCRTFIR
jgi:hypothetical protein